jgi:glycerophosphoryl diester phosphodiesterase
MDRNHVPFEVQGHRGMRGLYPENTLPGFEAAINAGVNVIECDILSTSDGVLIIHHDYAINKERCTHLGEHISIAPLICMISLAEIKRYDCGCANPDFRSQVTIPGTCIPTLEELFVLMKTNPKASSVRLNLEIKRDALHPEWTLESAWLAKKIVAEVKKSGLSDKTYYSSFDLEVLSEIREEDPNAEIGLLFRARGADRWLKDEIPKSILESAGKLQVGIFSPEHSYIKSQPQVLSYQEMGFRVIPWTVNDPNRWRELIKMRVDGIITDYPKSLLEYLAKSFER